MTEKRFTYGRAFPINSDDSLPVITDNENNKDYFRILDIVDLLNKQQEQISYWKHKVNGLLWILSQFDEEKVKELLKELEDE